MSSSSASRISTACAFLSRSSCSSWACCVLTSSPKALTAGLLLVSTSSASNFLTDASSASGGSTGGAGGGGGGAGSESFVKAASTSSSVAFSPSFSISRSFLGSIPSPSLLSGGGSALSLTSSDKLTGARSLRNGLLVSAPPTNTSLYLTCVLGSSHS